MKKLYIIILCLTVAITATGQTIGEAFYIYRNDGQFNAFFRDEVDSIAYSHYDLDSLYYDENVTQLVYTADSIYRIPLATIDSVGFVQPETVYREGTVPLEGNLFDYLLKAEDMLLTFSPSLPSNLIPKVDDKIVATELSEKLPNGFVGKVRRVESGASGIAVLCDSLALEDAVSQFYSVVEIVSDNGSSTRRYLKKKAPVETNRWPIDFNLPPIIIPIDISGVFTPEERFGRGGRAKYDISITPLVTGRMVRVVDDHTRLSYLNLHTVTDYETTTDIDLAGVVRTNFAFVRNLWVHQDIRGPWGIPVYYAYGPIIEASGELALGVTVNADFRHTADITFYPATVPYYLERMNPIVRALFQVTGIDQLVNAVNTVDNDVQNTRLDADWEYFAARGNITLGYAGRVGVSIPQHDVAWIGCEAQGGVKCDAQIVVDFDDLADAGNNTRIYDALKNNSNFTVMPYWGIQAVVSGLSDQVQVRFGRDDYTFNDTRWLNRGFLPIFSDTKASPNGSSAKASAYISNDCLFPWTVGFSLFDENGNRIGEPQWNDQKYWTHNGFNFPFETTFTDLASDRKYKVYPTLRLFDFPVLASPSADLDMRHPVTLSDFHVTNKQHEQGAFTHEGVAYDYRFDVTVTATLNDDAEGIADWGYVYLDPNGQEAFISLKQFGNSKTDDRWAYFRNGTPPFACTLYGYVKYVDSDEYVYGEPHDYPLEYEETICPDDHHPHMIDLGLPSGTLWACCNVGASTPEQYGNYYAWGETQAKSVYNWDTYSYGSSRDNVVYIGSDIAGTVYDAATFNWGAPWRMPSLAQIQELLNYTNSTWTTKNGVYGRKFTGSNGGTIFLPAAGCRWDSKLIGAGSHAYYWSSTLYGSAPDDAWGLRFYSSDALWLDDYRDNGLSVRPVR